MALKHDLHPNKGMLPPTPKGKTGEYKEEKPIEVPLVPQPEALQSFHFFERVSHPLTACTRRHARAVYWPRQLSW